MKDRIDRQIARLIQENPASSGFIPSGDRDRPGRLWDRIQRDGLRAVRARRIRRTCLCAAAGMLALFVGSLIVSFLWDGSGVQAFKEGLTRDIRTHGDEVSIEYHDDNPPEPAASFTPVHIEDGTVEDVESLDIFFPIPTALPEGAAFDTADIVYPYPGHANVRLSYRTADDMPFLISYLYGVRDISQHTRCDTVQTYEWDGIEVTHFINYDAPMDVFTWHIGAYRIEAYAGMDLAQARALFDDINRKLYEDWKKGDW